MLRKLRTNPKHHSAEAGFDHLRGIGLDAVDNHPSIFYTNPTQGRGGAGAYPSCHWTRGVVHPGQVTSPSQGHRDQQDKQPSTLTFTPTVSLESSTNLTCMSFGRGEEAGVAGENLDKSSNFFFDLLTELRQLTIDILKCF